ncbi:MAG: hypothetical protein PVG24_00645 [Gammaproteobacteria bacterium]
MLRALRIAILLYVLAFVAAGTLIDMQEATNWDAPLRVVVYPVAGDRSDSVQRYLDGLTTEDFTAVESFLSREAERYSIPLEKPVEIILAAERGITMPMIERSPSRLQIILWSLRMRWKSMLLAWDSEAVAPDIMLYAVYHDPASNPVLEGSTALRKGLIAIAHLFAEDEQSDGNTIVTAHELLHTLGATDKYSLETLLPDFPDGYFEPEQKPLHPQRFAEIMAGRLALSSSESTMPESLRYVRVGRSTAAEIGWAPAQ